MRDQTYSSVIFAFYCIGFLLQRHHYHSCVILWPNTLLRLICVRRCSYISLHKSISSFMPLSPNTFQNSAGILSTPMALFFFISPIADTISLSNKSGPLQSLFMSPSLPKTRSPGFGFPFLSYSISIYPFHLFRTSSGSVSNLPVSSLIVVFCCLHFA